MRLALISQDFPPDTGGIQTYAMELARRFASACEEFVVLAPAVEGYERIDEREEFPVIRVQASYDTFPVRAIQPLRRLVRTRDLEAVFHAQWPAMIASLGARWTGRSPGRLYLAAHGRELLIRPFDSDLAQRAHDRFRRHLLRQADRCFPVSAYTADLLRSVGVARDRITIVGNGTDPERFRPVEAPSLSEHLTGSRRPTLLTVGRLVERKGFDTTIRAVARLRDTFPDLLYVITGAGPDRARLEQLVAELEVADHVHFTGRIDYEELPRYYGGCDVFVMVSRSVAPEVEGFGIVFLEANACETPVVGARSGGIPDAVLDGKTGRLVPPGDPEALAEVLEELLSDPEEARRLGRAGRQRVLDTANWDAVARQLLTAMRPDRPPRPNGSRK